MKYFIMVLLGVMILTNTNAQIQETKRDNIVKIGSVKSVVSTVLELSSVVNESDTIYRFMYVNAKYQYTTDLKFIYFSEEGGTLQALYNILSDCLNNEKGTEKTFKLGNDEIYIQTSKSMGVKYLFFSVAEKGYTTITEKQLNKLFNK